MYPVLLKQGMFIGLFWLENKPRKIVEIFVKV